MWRKLYTNSGLILLAVLAAGVWFSNVRAIYQDYYAPALAEPSPTPRPTSAVESYEQELSELGRRVKAQYPEYNDLSDEDVGRRVKAKYPDANPSNIVDLVRQRRRPLKSNKKGP